MRLCFKPFTLTLSDGTALKPDRPLVMGILNVTPDSFSDGGRFNRPDAALSHARDMLAAGADIIDIGAESTRPGAAVVSAQEEMDRLLPVVTALRQESSGLISIDTSQPEVMRACAAAGADIWNDIRALTLPGAVAMAAKLKVPVCLMHMQGTPQTMQLKPSYTDIVSEVNDFLQERVEACLKGGIGQDKLILDPGLGFGKTVAGNYQLLSSFDRLLDGKYPVLIGLSRKSMLGAVTGIDVPAERLAPSLAGAVFAACMGAHIVRVHDVKETVQAFKVVAALKEYSC